MVCVDVKKDLLVPYFYRFFKYLLFCDFRHVKGRVLVALADGTLAIFHRGEGKNQRSKRKPDLAGSVAIDEMLF